MSTPLRGPIVHFGVDTMSADLANQRPIIIKRKKVVGGDGHHGGAWKVAYADFVTAMMAFFMLMWLLNATSEQQRSGLADYFTPTVTINRSSGGGEGLFGGDSVSSENVQSKMGEGSSQQHEGSQVNAANEPDEAQAGGTEPANVQALENLEEVLMAKGGESIHSDIALRHITTELTDEGLVIEFYDLPGASLFAPGTDDPMPVAFQIVEYLSEYIPEVDNPIAIRGHVRAEPIVVRESSVWSLSMARAAKIRQLLEEGGYTPGKIKQVAGEADRDPATSDLTNVRNNRIEVIVLRTDR